VGFPDEDQLVLTEKCTERGYEQALVVFLDGFLGIHFGTTRRVKSIVHGSEEV
jgi:hypothetical protein